MLNQSVICISDEISVDLVQSNVKGLDFIYAINHENIDELVKLLKEVGQKNLVVSDYESDPVTMLHVIAYVGKLEIFKTFSNTLTDLQPKVKGGERKGATPLHYAGQKGNISIIKFITNCIENINPPDTLGKKERSGGTVE